MLLTWDKIGIDAPERIADTSYQKTKYNTSEFDITHVTQNNEVSHAYQFSS